MVTPALDQPANGSSVSLEEDVVLNEAARLNHSRRERDFNRRLIENLEKTDTFKNFERAFSDATGLPLTISPVENWQLPHRGSRKENSFCAMLSEKSRSCASCLQTQQKLTDSVDDRPSSATCQAGLTDSAAPIKVGDELVGYLKTGQVFQSKPSEKKFQEVLNLLREWGFKQREEEIRDKWFNTDVKTHDEYQGALTILSIFAEQLGAVANQVMVQQANQEPPIITRARDFIRKNYTEPLTLAGVAKAVHCSSFYFCKLFKKATGLNFTDYVSRVRVEKAKELLVNPNYQIGEIAYEVGFQSLTHFNRVFRKVVGQAPSEFRRRLARGSSNG